MTLMIEETATGGFEIATQTRAMKVSNSHGIVRRSRNTDFTTAGMTSATGKRRRLCSQDHMNDFHLQCRTRRDADVILRENVLSTAISVTSDHVNSSCSVNDDSISDLKAECLSEKESFISGNDYFSRDTRASGVVCLKSEEIETLSMAAEAAENEATSGCKPPPAAESPPAAELEVFFAEAEKYEQKRFAKKYNFDIVKDIPMEGRYQWIRLELNR